jgi:hypothetical protein
MSTALELVKQIESAGGRLTLRGDRITYDVPAEITPMLDQVRANRDAVLQVLRERGEIPAMPPGVRLVSWKLKEAPVAIETCAVVTNPALFARTTLEQLRTAIAQPKRWVGWTVPQLIDRLQQVGVTVEVTGS